MSASPAVVVLTTVPVDLDVDKLAGALLDARLVACVSVLPPMRSLYRWQGVTEAAAERQVLMKTTARCVPELEAALRRQHPYELPEFLVVPVSAGSEAYLGWIDAGTGPARDG